MKIKCSHCFKTTDVTLDNLIFEEEDEELFVTYLSCEMSKETHLSELDCIPEKKNGKKQ